MLMYEYFIDTDKIKKISLRALKFMSKELESFLELYEKNILIVNKEELDNFNKLKQISTYLKEGNYGALMNNPELMIDFSDDDDEDEYLPSYFPL